MIKINLLICIIKSLHQRIHVIERSTSSVTIYIAKDVFEFYRDSNMFFLIVDIDVICNRFAYELPFVKLSLSRTLYYNFLAKIMTDLFGSKSSEAKACWPNCIQTGGCINHSNHDFVWF